MATNRYGLDARYFREKLSLVIEGLHSYKPEELSRELTRLANTAHQGALIAEVDWLVHYAEDHV